MMQLLHKYDITSLWPAYAQVLASTLPVSPASAWSGTKASLELLATCRRWDLQQVEQVITHALEQRLHAVSGLVGHQCAVSPRQPVAQVSGVLVRHLLSGTLDIEYTGYADNVADARLVRPQCVPSMNAATDRPFSHFQYMCTPMGPARRSAACLRACRA